MERFFNTTGPCDPLYHYMLPAEGRLPGLDLYVRRRLYFSLHAARQTGKTTLMRSFAERLRGLGYVALHMTLERGQGVEDVEQAEAIWMSSLILAATDLPEPRRPPSEQAVSSRGAGSRFSALLAAWSAKVHPAEVVLLIDEADTATGPAMVSLLRQLRGGFHQRPANFPASVALVGMRDLRDFITAAKDGAAVNPGSPFNIKQDSLTLRTFTRDEVVALLAQHAADTGQVFQGDAVDSVMFWTRGQPFLVNAIAQRCVDVLVPDRAVPISGDHVQQARELLIQARTTHLDSLSWRLREPRIQPIVRDILLGDAQSPISTTSDDFEYAVDLGLVVKGPSGPEIANPLYREVIARVLSQDQQDNLPPPSWRWQTASGGLDMAALVDAFLAWWRENSEAIRRHNSSPYPEAFPHLCFMAFLQRVVNGGGRIDREYAAGRERIDLLVSYGPDRHVVELKRVVTDGRSAEVVKARGVDQLAGYLDSVGCQEGWLVLFDERPGRTWDERLWAEDVTVGGRTLHLRGG